MLCSGDEAEIKESAASKEGERKIRVEEEEAKEESNPLAVVKKKLKELGINSGHYILNSCKSWLVLLCALYWRIVFIF